MLKQRVTPRAFIVVLGLGAGLALAQPPPGSQPTRVASATPPPQSAVQSRLGVYVFPKNGQSPDKQQVDELHCYDWAKAQTGFDPIATPPPAQQAPVQSAATVPQNTPATGATRGAAVGAIGGAIGGNAGKGAAIGAGIGAIRGNRQRRDAEEQTAAEQQAAAQAQAQQQQAAAAQMAGFRKAFSACLDGSGYTVK
jgi:Glycine-zipper domain